MTSLNKLLNYHCSAVDRGAAYLAGKSRSVGRWWPLWPLPTRFFIVNYLSKSLLNFLTKKWLQCLLRLLCLPTNLKALGTSTINDLNGSPRPHDSLACLVVLRFVKYRIKVFCNKRNTGKRDWIHHGIGIFLHRLRDMGEGGYLGTYFGALRNELL